MSKRGPSQDYLDIEKAIADDRISPLFASEVQDELTHLRNRIETLNFENGRQHVENEALRADRDRARKQVDDMIAAFDEVEADRDRLAAEVERLTKALDEYACPRHGTGCVECAEEALNRATRNARAALEKTP